MSITFHVVAATSELPDGGQLRVQLDEHEILLCHQDGHYYAIAYYCSHEALPLEGGTINDGCITCPYHGAEFDIATGEAKAPPAWEAVSTYPVKVENNVIAVGVDD